MEKVEEDRISELPDCLIVEILSRLPSTKEAIRTGTLSRRWKCLWTWVHTLIFTPLDYPVRQRLYDPNAMSEFFSYVDKSLTQCRQLKLKKFEVDTAVSTYYHILFESQFKNWIRYAIRCNVEELNLGIWNEELKAEQLLDEIFFVSSCFTNLKLKHVNFNPIRGISWKKLRSLSMVGVKLDENVIENILCGSPLLETLKLRYCYGYRQLNITSKSVKNLHLYGYGGPDDEIEGDIKINAPHILSLTMEDNMFLWMVSLLNVSALIEANLNYLELGDWGMTCEYEEKTLKDFIVNLLHVKDLKIGVACAKILSRLEAKGFKVPSNIKFLDVTNDWYNDLVESEEDL